MGSLGSRHLWAHTAGAKEQPPRLQWDKQAHVGVTLGAPGDMWSHFVRSVGNWLSAGQGLPAGLALRSNQCRRDMGVLPSWVCPAGAPAVQAGSWWGGVQPNRCVGGVREGKSLILLNVVFIF